ncbi:MAG: hypothetical protein COA58_14210 [Bacteroidetes bacterium]|nr:MAG: hypothetical protein COA58_14210 [Bacteroidota bacterium]
MSSYHNAVSDKLVVSLFPSISFFKVYSKDNQVRWSSLEKEGVLLPSELKESIFSSTSIISMGSKFTLVPLNVDLDKEFMELNFGKIGDLKTTVLDKLKVVEETKGNYKSVVSSLVNSEEYVDIGLLYKYSADKANGDALFFYPYQNSVTIVAWKDNQFQLANRYPSDNLDELFYYVMLVVEQLELNAEKLYFECISSKGVHESYHVLFKNYLAPLHLSKVDIAANQDVNDDQRQTLILSQFFAQCVL